MKPSVLVLCGGPDAEREVSLSSGRGVAEALARARHEVNLREIDRLTVDELASLPGDVVFPALHGAWGEGGPLQDLLELDGRPFVGSASGPARYAMDKVATKQTASAVGIRTPEVRVMNPLDATCPLAFPVVVKPIHEGSTIGLHVCRCQQDWEGARIAIETEATSLWPRPIMVERAVVGNRGQSAREVTVGLLDGEALPLIEIVAPEGLFDFEAKYVRSDTRYILDPELPPDLVERLTADTKRLASTMGLRHVCRADFLIDDSGAAWFLEINTMPGFTSHSLVPRACARLGIDMPELCTRLVELALRDARVMTTLQQSK